LILRYRATEEAGARAIKEAGATKVGSESEADFYY